MVTNTNQRNVIRQGDLLLIPVATLPEDYVQHVTRRMTSGAIIGHGETSGHQHVIDKVQWIVPDGTTDGDLWDFAETGKQPAGMPVFVFADEPTELTHEEHAPLPVEPGAYQVVRQQEYAPAAPAKRRAVFD